jgi:MFS family permease
LAFGGGLLLGGRLGDLYGRRRMLVVGMGVFAAGALAAALAPSLGVLIAARAAQGAGLALLGVLTTRRRDATSPNVSATKERLTWQAKPK